MRPELLSISGGAARRVFRIYWQVSYAIARPIGHHHARRETRPWASGYVWRRKTAEHKINVEKRICYQTLKASPKINVGHLQ